MINAILKGIFSLVIGLVNLLLSPIDSIISQFFPTITQGLNYVSSFFSWLSNIIPWVMSWMGIDSAIVTLLVGYYTFKLTVPLMVHTVKLAIKWYDKIKP